MLDNFFFADNDFSLDKCPSSKTYEGIIVYNYLRDINLINLYLLIFLIMYSEKKRNNLQPHLATKEQSRYRVDLENLHQLLELLYLLLQQSSHLLTIILFLNSLQCLAHCMPGAALNLRH